MSTVSNISGYLSTAEAADILGSTAHHIARLARDGEISSLKTAGGALLVDAASFQTYLQIRTGKGRPLTPQMAFAALWELSGRHAPWLSYAQKRRLGIKLADTTAENLVWAARKRAVVKRYRASASFLPHVKTRMMLSGRSAEAAGILGLVGNGDLAEGYICADEVEPLVSACFLEEDARGNVVVHVAEWLPEPGGSLMPEAVIAADLAASLDTRERSAGLAKLEELIDKHAKTSGH